MQAPVGAGVLKELRRFYPPCVVADVTRCIADAGAGIGVAVGIVVARVFVMIVALAAGTGAAALARDFIGHAVARPQLIGISKGHADAVGVIGLGTIAGASIFADVVVPSLVIKVVIDVRLDRGIRGRLIAAYIGCELRERWAGDDRAKAAGN